jgi:hypothetical protein
MANTERSLFSVEIGGENFRYGPEQGVKQPEWNGSFQKFRSWSISRHLFSTQR